MLLLAAVNQPCIGQLYAHELISFIVINRQAQYLLQDAIQQDAF